MIKRLTLGLLLLIFAAAWLLQVHLFLNGDVSYYLHAAQSLLAGGTYSQDFFNPNPPLSLFLYMPALLLSAIFKCSLLLSFRLYAFTLIALVLGVCFSLVQKLFSQEGPYFVGYVMAVLAAVFLLLPLYHFGQRDHLLVIFTLPYLLLVALRLEGRPKEALPSVPTQVFIGLLAGLGFALKPQFLLIPLLVELYYLYRKTSFLSWCRAEVLAYLGLFLYLALMMVFFYPDYLKVVIPFVMQYYYPSVGTSWQDLVLYQPLLFCYAAFLLASNNLLRVALLALMLTYFSQRTTFFYHALPALTLAVFILSLSVIHYRRSHLKILMSVFLFAMLLPLLHQVYFKGIEYKEEVLGKMIGFMQTQQHPKTMMVMARWGSYGFPVADYIGSRPVQRFDCLWPVVALSKQKGAGRDFFINMVTDDLERNRPDVVLVDSEDHSFTEDGAAFNYLVFFSENERFRKAWQDYRYQSSLDVYPRYKLDVYQRNPKT